MKQWLIASVSLLAIAGSLVTVQRHRHPEPPPLKLGPFLCYGEVIAQESAALIKSHGQIVLWRPKFNTPSRRLDAVVDAFRESVLKTGSRSIVAEEQDTILEDGRLGEMETCPVTATRLRELLQKHPQADLLVLVGGAPRLSDAELKQLPKHGPKVFIAILGGDPLNKSVFNSRLVQAAIVPRLADGPPETPAQTDVDRFDDNYMLVTPQTAHWLDWVPASAAAK